MNRNHLSNYRSKIKGTQHFQTIGEKAIAINQEKKQILINEAFKRIDENSQRIASNKFELSLV